MGRHLFIGLLFILLLPSRASGLASNNMPLDSPAYEYLEKLSGFGLVDGEIHGIRPYSKAEAARLLMEAEQGLERLGEDERPLAEEAIQRLKYLLPREVDLYNQEDEAPVFDISPLSGLKLRYVYFDGRPRDFQRWVLDPGGEGVFGIGRIRPKEKSGAVAAGMEGTPLFENNEGTVYEDGSNFEARASAEVYLNKYVTALAEPLVVSRPSDRGEGSYISFKLNKGYIKLGGKGLEFEAGRDANWLGQGYRHTLILSNNARNLDQLKLSSPEPVGWKWLRKNVGLVKYAVIVSRLESSGSGADLRRPWFIAYKLSAKLTPDFELGLCAARQAGGPNVKVGGGAMGVIFGGVKGDGSNFIGGFDMRLRIPALRHTAVYFEYAGEDSASFWPTVESYVAGVHIPRLTADGRNDLRFEFYLGKPILYTNYQFPEGYTNGGLVMGDSQGGDAKEYFARFTHYFSLRNTLALEYFHTQRGRLGRNGDQRVEEKDAGRIFCNMAISNDWGMMLGYGYERIRNFNLTGGSRQGNHLFRAELTWRY